MNNNFICRDYFMIRTPLLNNSSKEINNDLFELSILISSPSLFHSMNKFNNLNDKKKKDIKESLYKYYNRMSNRCTPFGLFSGINIGEIDKLNNSKNKIKRISTLDNSHIYVDIDYAWFNYFIADIEKNIDVYNFSISLNNLILKTPKNYIINGDKRSSIERNILLDKIYNYMEENKNVSFKQLLNYIKTINGIDNNNDDEIKNYISDLINFNFLITNLKDGNFNFLYKKLLEINSIYKLESSYSEIINEINLCIEEIKNEFNNHNYKKVSDIILLLSNRMNDFYTVSMPLKFDLKIGMKDIKLNENILQNAVDGLFHFILLSHQKYKDRLFEYHSLFLEEYGVDQLVNIKQCIDEFKGIGIPEEKQNNINYNPKIYREIQKINYKNKDKIILNDELFEKIDSNLNFQKSGELYCYIYKHKNTDEYIIEFSEMIASFCAGNSFGRFLPLIDSTLWNKIMKTNDEIVNVIEYPNNNKSGNVINSINNSKHNIQLGTFINGKSLNLDDLFIGADLNELYIYSSEINKKITINTPSMINYEYQSDIYKTLFKFSNYSIDFPNKIMNQSSFHIPRIQWKNIIFQSERWQLDADMIQNIEIGKYSYLNNHYNIPQFIWISDNDNRLYIDLKNDKDLKLLISELKKRKNIWICEDVLKRDDLENILTDENNTPYQSEFIIPFDLEKQVTKDKDMIPSYYMTDDNKLKNYSFERNWFYCVFYIENNFQLKCLSKTINNLLNELFKNGLIKKWFFIRYKENNKDTIRLRIQVSSDKNAHQKLYDIFKKWYVSSLENDEINNYEIRNYIPEISRYGGYDLMNYCESLFEIDSNYILMQYMVSKEDNFYEDYIAITGYFLLITFGIENDEIVSITNDFVTNEQKNIIHNNRKELLDLTKNNFEKFKNKFPFLNTLFIEYKQKILDIKEQFNKKNINQNKAYRIIMSILHMHFNRGYGVNQYLEGLAMAKINTIAKGMKYIG